MDISKHLHCDIRVTSVLFVEISVEVLIVDIPMFQASSRKTYHFIRKTFPCNEYPLKSHFYIVKLGYAGVYLFFLFLLQNIDCGYSLEPPRQGGSNVYPQSMF